MIRHIVLLQIPNHADPFEVETMIRQLEQAALAVPGTVAFCGGAKLPGSWMGQGFTHAVNIDFVDEAARDAYLDRRGSWRHSDHEHQHRQYQHATKGFGQKAGTAMGIEYIIIDHIR